MPREAIFPLSGTTPQPVSLLLMYKKGTGATIFELHMRMPLGAFCDLVDALRPRLSRLGVPPVVRTAIALRYFGGGSYIDSGETPFARKRSNSACLMP